MNSWVKYRIIEPKFDESDAQMPNLEAAPKETEAIADFLTGRQSLSSQALDVIFGSRRGIAVFTAGFVAASLAWILLLSSFEIYGIEGTGFTAFDR